MYLVTALAILLTLSPAMAFELETKSGFGTLPIILFSHRPICTFFSTLFYIFLFVQWSMVRTQTEVRIGQKSVMRNLCWTSFDWKLTFIDCNTSHFLLFCIVQTSFACNINWLFDTMDKNIDERSKKMRKGPKANGSSITWGKICKFLKNSKFKYFQLWILIVHIWI